VLLQACLNGSRRRWEHPTLPLDAAAIAADAAQVVAAGAVSLHIHPRDRNGAESLQPSDVEACLEAVRAACPGIRVGVTTAAWIEPDPKRRLESIEGWEVLPDFASVNLAEEEALAVVDALAERGVGVEAGVWTLDDARMLIEAGLDEACERVLVEVDAIADGATAARAAAAIDATLDGALIQASRLHHGGGVATWDVIAAAITLGHDVRIGLEDTLVDRRGVVVESNAALVAAVVAMAGAAGRVVSADT